MLQLSTSLYMLKIYDQVLPSRSLSGLALLTGLVLGLHMAFAFLDWIRSRALCRAGLAFVQDLDRRAHDVIRTGGPGCSLEPLGDVERVRRFLTNAGPSAFADVLWLPVFLVAIFLLHPALAAFAATAMLLLAGLAFASEALSREAAHGIARLRHRRFAVAREIHEAARARRDGRQHPEPFPCWRELAQSYYQLTAHATERALRIGAFGKALRLALQSIGLGLGALLVIEGALSAGALIASSVIMSRTFASLDAALVHWRGFAAARESYLRLEGFLGEAQGRGWREEHGARRLSTIS